ncbi:LysR substrate-binding domain-containing protein [Acidisoma silvae]|uniref:LysR family transcriptional regulator n=1 Tax=Acidisoma silvae TaxID=2802396 RepID=A0A964E153_9PROT|nr:LysR substrate-binding domain-containing protein [Acidisoma silvae]MCB8877862.1 LysR family transcriptional regulator [Acidisoma silvae]
MAIDPHSQLTGISAFVHTVETGSFTAAAARMGLSKSAAAKKVARLEDRLGARLLERTTRRLNLTVEGEAYYRSCLKVLDELSATEALLASRQQAVSGRLRINLPISFGRLCIMPVLMDLLAQHPRLDLDVSFADRRVDLVEEGIDLAVRLGEPGDQASLIGRRIGTQRSVICGSPAYFALRGYPQSFEDLADHDCLGFVRDGRSSPWTIALSDGALRDLAIKPRHTVSHGEALRDATLSGLGLSYLSTWLIADDVRSGRLESVLLAEPVMQWPITALWPRVRDLTPKVRVTVDALVKAFSPLPRWDRLFSQSP